MNDLKANSLRLAGYIRYRRAELNMTQEDLADKSGIDYKHIQNFESYRKTNDPKFSTLCKLADALKISIIDLVVHIKTATYTSDESNRPELLVSEDEKE